MRTVLPIAGAIIGGIYGGAAGAQFGYALGSIVGNAVDPQHIAGPKIGDIGVQTAMEGAWRPIVYGTAHVTGNIVYYGPIKKKMVETQAGKGGPVTETERIYRHIVIRICEAPEAGITGLSRIWENDKLVYDTRPESTIIADTAKFAKKFRFYDGNDDQLPDPDIEAVLGAGNAPAYIGSAYIVFGNADVTDTRGAANQYRFEVVGAGVETTQTEITYALGELSGFFNSTYEDIFPLSNYQAIEEAAGVYRYQYRLTKAGSGYSAEGGNILNMIGAVNAKWYLGYSARMVESLDDNYGMWPQVPQPDVSDLVTIQILFGEQKPDVILDVSFNDKDAAAAAMGGGPPPESTWFMDLGGNVCQCVSLGGGDPRGALFFMNFDGGSLITHKMVGYFPYVAATTRLRADVQYVYGDPCSDGVPKLLPDVPGWVVDCLGDVFPLPSQEPVSGPYYALAQDATAFSGDPATQQYTRYAQAPFMPYGDPRNTDAFWTAAYNAAVAAGDLPPGLVYPTDYPTTAVQGVKLTSTRTILSKESVVVGAIVSDVSSRCRLPPWKYDVSELNDPVIGLALAGPFTGAAAIQTLQSAHFFDLTEYDKKIWYPKRGKPTVATITIDDLVEADEDSTREQSIEYPKALLLSYQSAKTGYVPTIAPARRSSPDVRVSGDQSAEVPEVLSEDEAAQIADKMLKTAWSDARGERSFTLPMSFLRFVPGDCIALCLRGKVDRLRIEQQSLTDGRMPLRTRYDRQSAYGSTVTGNVLPGPDAPPSNVQGPTAAVLGDWPALTDSDDRLGYYAAAAPLLSGWYGARIERTAGDTFVGVADVTVGATIGYLEAPVAAASADFIDRTNVLRVRLHADVDLYSLTDLQFLSEGGGLAIVDSSGAVELVQYRDAAEVDTQLYELSTLVRGRLYTSPAEHAARSRVVLLSGVQFIEASSVLLGTDLTHRAVSYGTSAEAAAQQTMPFAGRSQREFPVAYLHADRDGSTVTASWLPAHRFGSDAAPVASINFTGYRVTLDDGAHPPVSFDTLTPQFSYDASALASPVAVSVAALNRITGPGPATSESV